MILLEKVYEEADRSIFNAICIAIIKANHPNMEDTVEAMKAMQAIANAGFSVTTNKKNDWDEKIQFTRKENNYEIMDRIEIKLSGDEEIKKAVELPREYICSETLANSIVFSESADMTEWDIKL